MEDLVAFAREPRLERTTIDLPFLARDVVSRLERSGELRDEQVRVEGARHAEVAVDPARIGQVLRNLLLNAAAAAGKDCGIVVHVEDDPAFVAIRIQDRGVGIADDDLPRVFEPFFSKRPGGTGLGLAVSHGIVMAHGGNIEIRSTSGEGTTVTVQLPKIRQEAP